MSKETLARKAHMQARGALWASMGFYVLIAFEFFYMASPFAAYLYAVYGPGLDWLQRLVGDQLGHSLLPASCRCRDPLCAGQRARVHRFRPVRRGPGWFRDRGVPDLPRQAATRRRRDGRALPVHPSPAIPGADRREHRHGPDLAKIPGPGGHHHRHVHLHRARQGGRTHLPGAVPRLRRLHAANRDVSTRAPDPGFLAACRDPHRYACRGMGVRLRRGPWI